MKNKKQYSNNPNAETIVGKRNLPEGTITFDIPAELGFHCPLCNYKHTVNGNYDERLEWSEYNGFLWCSVCNLDIPSCLCVPNLNKLKRGKGTEYYEYDGLKDAIRIFLHTIQSAKEKLEEPKQ